MNNILNIKMNLVRESNPNKPGPRNLNKTRTTKSEKLFCLINNLREIKKYYESNRLLMKDTLIDVYYNDIISKSGRIQDILCESGDCNDKIVGARFSDSTIGNENHIITYYVKNEVIDLTIKKLEDAISFIDSQLNGEATSKNFDSSDRTIDYTKSKYSMTKLRNIIIDCSVIEKFDIPNAYKETTEKQLIVTFFKTELNIYEILNKLGIDGTKYYYRSAGENTISVSIETYKLLVEKIPYMISMVASDISLLNKSDICNIENRSQSFIINPTNEPTIGVIDTLFDENVYFNKWVDYHEYLTDTEKLMIRDIGDYKDHGTAVTSIIVDGPSLNPDLEDGCGHFKVRHFGVCPGRINPTLLVKKIEEIIVQNQDIHVWNLSLGTEEEVSKNFISFDAAALDKIQKEYNVIFIIAGTNNLDKGKVKMVGSPADSLNSIVVNSVKKNGQPASYSRNGKILSFFNKPDVSYYGGDYDERIYVYTNRGIDLQYGTSFAAPWIARKVCYLIDVIGFTREVAKAIIIDSAAGWNYKQGNYKNKNLIGYGIVPKKIDSILQTTNSEIRFVISGNINSYNTSNYAIPVPKDEENKTSYIARATLCYFPECNRLQGVDYTQRELSLKFGPIDGEKIKDINYNTQEDDDSYNDERKARDEFRKWENTKFISSLLREKNIRSKKIGKEGFWGFTITSKERRKVAKKDNINFGLVITLRNIWNINRINEFKHLCLLRGYIVNEIEVENKISIYEKLSEDINLE